MSESEPAQSLLEQNPLVAKATKSLEFQEDFSNKLVDAGALPISGGEVRNPEFDMRMHFEQVRERFEELVKSAGSLEYLIEAVRNEAQRSSDAERRTVWFEVLQQLGG